MVSICVRKCEKRLVGRIMPQVELIIIIALFVWLLSGVAMTWLMILTVKEEE